MLTMGMTALLTDWFGARRTVADGARSGALVFPGGALAATATVTSVGLHDELDVADVDVVTTNQNGEVVLSATARMALRE